jgi:K+-transporting ATPase ATPase C chain
MARQLKTAVLMLLAMTVLTGGVYPALVTLVARSAFPDQASGSLVFRDGRLVGSRLIGQPFHDARYFWGRPSATEPVPYDAEASGSSNLGPENPALLAAVRRRIAALHAADPAAGRTVPVDLVTSSASGLDPDITVAAVLFQVKRVAAARGLALERVRALVERLSASRSATSFGPPRVNVLELNLALDALR